MQETVTTGRAKRSTAGNRMRELLEKAHKEQEEDELFAEDEDDAEFEQPAEMRDVFLDEFADTDEEIDDEEAQERALRREERQANKAKASKGFAPVVKAPRASQPTFSNEALAMLDPSLDPNKMAPSTLVLEIRKKKREEKRLHRSEARRSNLRASTLAGEEALREKERQERAAIAVSKKGRKPQHQTGEVRGARPMTQAELIAAALEEEERNKEALTDWLRKEEEKRELRRVGRKRVRGPRWTWVSRTVGKLVEVVGEENGDDDKQEGDDEEDSKDAVNEKSPDEPVDSATASRAITETPARDPLAAGVPQSEPPVADTPVDKAVANGASQEGSPTPMAPVKTQTPGPDASTPATAAHSDRPLASTGVAPVTTKDGEPPSGVPEGTSTTPPGEAGEASKGAQAGTESSEPPSVTAAASAPPPADPSEPPKDANADSSEPPKEAIAVLPEAAPEAATPTPATATAVNQATMQTPPSSAHTPGLASAVKPGPDTSDASTATVPPNGPVDDSVESKQTDKSAEPRKSSASPTAADADADPDAGPSQYMRNYLILSQVPGGLPAEMQLILGDHVDWSDVKVIPARNRPIYRKPPTDPLTGLPAKYRHPSSMVPYSSQESYKTLEAVLNQRYVWTPGGWWAGGEADAAADGVADIPGWREACARGWLGGKEVPAAPEEPEAEKLVGQDGMEEDEEPDAMEVDEAPTPKATGRSSRSTKRKSRGERADSAASTKGKDAPRPAKKSKTKSKRRR